MGQNSSSGQRKQLDFVESIFSQINSASCTGGNTCIEVIGRKRRNRFSRKDDYRKRFSVKSRKYDFDPSLLLLSESACLQRFANCSPDYFSSKIMVHCCRLNSLMIELRTGFEVQRANGWNIYDKSPNMIVTDGNDVVVHRHPVAQSTDGIRRKVGYSRGLHCWEIHWNPKKWGTHATVGVCTKNAPLTCGTYRSLIGDNNESWGWDLKRNSLHHDDNHSKHKKIYSKFAETQSFVAPKKIIVILDMDEGSLSFVANNQHLGVAFIGLNGKTLYPAVSCVWGDCKIEIRYINESKPSPPSLLELCRKRIRMSLGVKRLNQIKDLSIPNSLKDFISHL